MTQLKSILGFLIAFIAPTAEGRVEGYNKNTVRFMLTGQLLFMIRYITLRCCKRENSLNLRYQLF